MKNPLQRSKTHKTKANISKRLTKAQKLIVAGAVAVFVFQLGLAYQVAVPTSIGLNYRVNFNSKYRPFINDVTAGTFFGEDVNIDTSGAKNPEINNVDQLKQLNPKIKTYRSTLNDMIKDDKKHFVKLPFIYINTPVYEDMKQSHTIITEAYPSLLVLLSKQSEMIEYVSAIVDVSTHIEAAYAGVDKIDSPAKNVDFLEASLSKLDLAIAAGKTSNVKGKYADKMVTLVSEMQALRNAQQLVVSNYRSANYGAYNNSLNGLGAQFSAMQNGSLSTIEKEIKTDGEQIMQEAMGIIGRIVAVI